jgi:hypothetical protein
MITERDASTLYTIFVLGNPLGGETNEMLLERISNKELK